MAEEPDLAEQIEEISGLRQVLALLTDGKSKLRAGDLTLDENGHVHLRRNNEALRFAFAYRGADFQARMETDPEARITLSAELGKVPYSMEPASGRRVTQRIIDATTELPGGRIEVSETQEMSLVAMAQPPHPLTPASIMAAITSLLLDFRPYIDLLREIILMADSGNSPAPGPSSSPEPQPE